MVSIFVILSTFLAQSQEGSHCTTCRHRDWLHQSGSPESTINKCCLFWALQV